MANDKIRIVRDILRMLDDDLHEVERAIEQTQRRMDDLVAEKFAIHKARLEAEHIINSEGKDVDNI